MDLGPVDHANQEQHWLSGSEQVMLRDQEAVDVGVEQVVSTHLMSSQWEGLFLFTVRVRHEATPHSA